jgi:hypothetical protein
MTAEAYPGYSAAQSAPARAGAPLIPDLTRLRLWSGVGSAAHHFAIARLKGVRRPYSRAMDGRKRP